MKPMLEVLEQEFEEQCQIAIRALDGMIFSLDQNGHLVLHRGDVSTLVLAVELLKSSSLKFKSRK